MKAAYPATFTPQEPSGFLVQFVDIEEAFTGGETIEECLFNGAEVLTGILETYIDHGKEIPKPTPDIENAYYIAPDVKMQSALLIRWARGKTTMSDFARELKTSWQSAQRLEKPTNATTLAQLQKSAVILGKRLVLTME